MKCCICGGEIEAEISGWNFGNNAEPIKNGRYCNYCNDFVVIPTRIKIFMERRKNDNL